MARHSQSEKSENKNLDFQRQRHMLLTAWSISHSGRPSPCTQLDPA